MSASDCYEKIKEYAKKNAPELKESELYRFAKKLDILGTESLTPAEFNIKAQALITEEEMRGFAKDRATKLMAAEQKLNHVASIRATRTKYLKAINEGRRGIIPGISPDPNMQSVEAFRNWYQGGSIKPGYGGNLEVEHIKNAVEVHLNKVLMSELRGIEEEFSSGEKDYKTLQYLSALQNNASLEGMNDPIALKAAKAINNFQSSVLKLKQAYSPHLEAAQDYLVKQFHNREKVAADVSEEGISKWLAKALHAFGEKSFEELPLDKKAEVFLDTHKSIVDGTHGSLLDDTRTTNLAMKQSRQRQYIAGDVDKWYDYFKAYGPDTLYDGLLRVTRTAAHDIAMMSKFGSNPENMFKEVHKAILKGLSGAERQAFIDNEKNFLSDWRIVNGSQSTPARGMGAKIVQGAILQQRVTKAGLAILRSQPDIALAASLVTDTGGNNIFSNGAKVAHFYYEAMLDNKIARKNMDRFLIFSRGAKTELMRTLAPLEGTPGHMAKLANVAGKYSLMSRHADAIGNAIGMSLGHDLGKLSNTSFSELNPVVQGSLHRYSLGGENWDLYRLGTEIIEGKEYMTPEGILGIPDDAVKNYLARSGNEKPTKNELARVRYDGMLKLGALYNEHAALGEARGGARQRTFLLGDTDVNSFNGAFLRVLTQFKEPAVTAFDVFRRRFHSSDTTKGGYAALMSTFLLASFFGAMEETFRNLYNNKTPEDPLTPEFAGKIIASSGLGAAWGDAVIDAAQQEGGYAKKTASIVGNIAGPAIGSLADLAGTGLEALSEAKKKGKLTGGTARHALDLAYGNIPFSNFPLVKPTLNYFLINESKELLDNGYIFHYKQNIGKTPGLLDAKQRLIWNPSAWRQ